MKNNIIYILTLTIILVNSFCYANQAGKSDSNISIPSNFEINENILSGLDGVLDRINLDAMYFHQFSNDGNKFIALFAEEVNDSLTYSNNDIWNVDPSIFVEKKVKNKKIYLYTLIGTLNGKKWTYRFKYKLITQDYDNENSYLLDIYLRDIKFTETSFFPINVFLSTQKPNEYSIKFSEIFDYDVTVIDDSLHFLISNSDFYCTNHYKLFGTKLEIQQKYHKIENNYFSKVESNHYYFEDSNHLNNKSSSLYSIDLITHQKEEICVLPERSVLNNINDIYSSSRDKFIIYEDYDPNEKFVFAYDNSVITYKKNYILGLNDTVKYSAELIQKGYKYCHNFKSFSSSDTLYAIWYERIDKFLPILSVFPIKSEYHIMFNKFDGIKWNNSVSVIEWENEYSDDGKNIFSYSPLGVYKIKKKIYSFWEYKNISTNDKDNSKIFYNWSTNGVNWSAPVELGQNLIMTSSYCENESILHILFKPSNKSTEKYYYTFDGQDLIKMGSVINENSSSEKIIYNNNKLYLIWSVPNEKTIKFKYLN